MHPESRRPPHKPGGERVIDKEMKPFEIWSVLIYVEVNINDKANHLVEDGF